MEVLDEIVLDMDEVDARIKAVNQFKETTIFSEARIMLLMTDPATAAMLMWEGDQAFMGGLGYGWMLNSHAIRSVGQIADSLFRKKQGVRSVIETGAMGFFDEDRDWLKANPMNSFLQIYTLLYQAIIQLGYI